MRPEMAVSAWNRTELYTVRVSVSMKSDGTPSHSKNLRRFQNHVGVLHGIAAADQADRQRNPFLEIDVRLVGERDAGKCLGKGPADFRAVVLQEFFRHPGLADDEVAANRPQHVEHRGDAVDERDVDGLDARPEGKAPVGDDQRVRMPDAAQKRVDLRIEDAGFEHGGHLGFLWDLRSGTIMGGFPREMKPLAGRIAATAIVDYLAVDFYLWGCCPIGILGRAVASAFGVRLACQRFSLHSDH